MSYLGLGLSQGATKAGDYHRGQDMRNMQMEEAKLRQKASEAQFKTQQEMAPLAVDQAKLQLEQLKMETRQMQAQMFKGTTYEAFRLYNSDKDPKHLNQLVKQAKSSPVGQSLFGKTARVDAISDLPAHRKLLQEAGIEDVDGLLGNKDVAGQFVVMTDVEGGQSLLDMAQVYAGTGYTQHMADEELKRLNTQSLIAQRMREGNSMDRTTALERLAREMAEEEGIPVYEAYQRLTKKEAKGGSERERLAEQIMEQNPGMSYLDAYEQAATLGRAGSETERTARTLAEKSGRPYAEVLRELQQEKQMTAGQKDVSAANDMRAELDEAFEGKYFETNFADPVARRKAQPYVTGIEKLTGRELTNEDKRAARSIRTLTALGSQGSEVTAAETGPLDTLLRETKSYFYDDLGGNKQAVAAYAAFRNIARNALFGAALTDNEIKEFNRSLATLSKQPGTILSQLRVQMDNIRNDMQAIYDFNDEHVAHYYLGKGLDELDESITAIDERLNYMNKLGANEGKGRDIMLPAAPITREPGAPRKPLAEILGGQ